MSNRRDPFDAMADNDDARVARELELAERDNCQLCDEDGYRPNTMVCDHVDREATAARGRALVQAELDKIRQRKARA